MDRNDLSRREALVPTDFSFSFAFVLAVPLGLPLGVLLLFG